ncbi:MAG: hypothetical protein ACR2HC_09410 [Thermoleophilaceae bacterium]
MIDLTETATFRGDDAVCLVEASLACRVCLSGEIEWSMHSSEWDPEVVCRCETCGDVRSVWLNGEQALRLSLDSRLGAC